jgi:hypothetical protein
LWSGTGGATLKRATTTGILKGTSGVISAATSGTDYAPATSGSGILKGNGSGGFSTATAGTDYVDKATTSTLTAGYLVTSTSGGTITGAGQTYTPTPSTSKQNFQHITLNGSSLTGTFTVSPPGSPCTVILEVTNGGTGAVGATLSTSGFTKVIGDTYATTNGNKYLFQMVKTNSYSLLSIQALQ